jgi:hypothetical protein
MYRPFSGPAFSAAGGWKAECFRLAPRTLPYTPLKGSSGAGARSDDLSPRVYASHANGCNCRIDAAGILTLRAEKTILCPHPVFSSTSL